MQHSKKPFTVLLDKEFVQMTFEQMYKKYKRPVYYMIKKLVKNDDLIAEELTNDTFINVLKKIDQYSTEFAISTWIFSIGKNLVIDHLRKKTLETMSLENVYVDWLNGEELPQTDRLIQLNDSANNPEEQMIEQETMRTMHRKFERLNESVKAVATLFFFNGLSLAEVAEELRMPLGTVKAKVHRARTTMMEAMPVEMRKTVTV